MLGAFGAPPARQNEPASSYVTPWDLTRAIAYLGQDGNIYLLTSSPQYSGWAVTNVTAAAGVPGTAASAPSAYAYPDDQTQHIVYLTANGHVHELWWADSTGRWTDGDLTVATGAPVAAGAGQPWTRPAGLANYHRQHVTFRAFDNAVWQLSYNQGRGWSAVNPSQLLGAPPATGNPATHV
jgi:hypothetical protein